MQKITLIGNLGKDPEERYTSNNKKVVTFSVAVKISKDITLWYDCNIWEDKLPMFEKVLTFMTKGTKVCIMGDLGVPDSYQNKQGNTVIKNRVQPFSITLIGGDGNKKEEVPMPAKKPDLYANVDYENLPF